MNIRQIEIKINNLYKELNELTDLFSAYAIMEFQDKQEERELIKQSKDPHYHKQLK